MEISWKIQNHCQICTFVPFLHSNAKSKQKKMKSVRKSPQSEIFNRYLGFGQIRTPPYNNKNQPIGLAQNQCAQTFRQFGKLSKFQTSIHIHTGLDWMFMQTYILTRIVKLQYGKTGFEKETSSRSPSIGPLSGSNRILQPPRYTHISPLLIRSEIRPVHKTFWITADFGTLWQLCYYNKNSLMCAPFLNTIVNKSIRGRVKLNGQSVDPPSEQRKVKNKHPFYNDSVPLSIGFTHTNHNHHHHQPPDFLCLLFSYLFTFSICKCLCNAVYTIRTIGTNVRNKTCVCAHSPMSRDSIFGLSGTNWEHDNDLVRLALLRARADVQLSNL